MSLPQGSCPMRDTIHNPNQPHIEMEHHPSNFYDLELEQQQVLDQTHDRRSTGIKLAQIDREESVRGQQLLMGRNTTYADEGRRSGNTLSSQAQHEISEKEQEEQHNIAYKRSAFRNHIANFQWQWFACTMSTGGLAILLSEQPHTFRGLQTIGKVFFIIELVLFVIFTCSICLRFILDRKSLVRSLTDPIESFFFSCFWVSQATIIGNIQRYGVPACGPWLIKALEVLQWYYVGGTLLSAIFLFATHFNRHDLSIDKVQPSWTLGIYPIMLAGTVASLLAPDQPTTSALAIIMGGIAFVGVGFMIAFMIITMCIWRYFNVGLPPPQIRVGMFVMVGMPGFTATSLQGLAQAAVKHFPPGYMGATSIPAGEVLLVLSQALSAWLWLLSFVFFSWSVVSVAYGVKKMSFDVSWWACVFPNVGWAIATSLQGQALNSQGIQWVASAMAIMLVVFWLFVAAFHLKAIFQGRTPPGS